jgi:UDP-N-acetylmuramate dehydrogenase
LKQIELDFSKFSSIKVGQVERVNIIESIEELAQFENPFIVGGGNNLLLSDSVERELIKLSKDFSFINVYDNVLHIGGATKSSKIFNFTKVENIGGFEFLQRLPGTLGGILKMNAGLKNYEIFENLIAVRFRDGWVEKKEIDFGYRFTSINQPLFEAKFKLNRGFNSSLIEKFKLMRANQPRTPSAGSTFKNPEGYSAGFLLEKVGLRGYRLEDMGFSDVHSNFLVNYGGGKFKDAIKLIELAEERVSSQFGVKLQREIVIV